MHPVGEQRRVEPRPCEDCGSEVVSGLEPFDHGYDRSDWCTNLDCPSNKLRGLHRIGVNDYQCLKCGAVLRSPFTEVASHRRTHTGQPNGPGLHTYS